MRGETHVVQVMEASPQVTNFLTDWIASLETSIDATLETLNEEEKVKPSLPILDWTDENEDESPF